MTDPWQPRPSGRLGAFANPTQMMGIDRAKVVSAAKWMVPLGAMALMQWWSKPTPTFTAPTPPAFNFVSQGPVSPASQMLDTVSNIVSFKPKGDAPLWSPDIPGSSTPLSPSVQARQALVAPVLAAAPGWGDVAQNLVQTAQAGGSASQMASQMLLQSGLSTLPSASGSLSFPSPIRSRPAAVAPAAARKPVTGTTRMVANAVSDVDGGFMKGMVDATGIDPLKGVKLDWASLQLLQNAHNLIPNGYKHGTLPGLNFEDRPASPAASKAYTPAAVSAAPATR